MLFIYYCRPYMQCDLRMPNAAYRLLNGSRYRFQIRRTHLDLLAPSGVQGSPPQYSQTRLTLNHRPITFATFASGQLSIFDRKHMDDGNMINFNFNF